MLQNQKENHTQGPFRVIYAESVTHYVVSWIWSFSPQPGACEISDNLP